MHESWRAALELLHHDPSVLSGFLLIAVGAILFVHIQFRMRSVGYKTYPMFSRPKDWSLPAEYLKVREKHGWPAWPAYLVWPCYAVGIALLVFGLFRLHD